MQPLKTIIESRRFELAITWLIVVNAITLGLETSPAVMARGADMLHLIDHLLLGIFVAELLAKMMVYRLSFFRDPWRIFDLAVIGISLLPASGTLSILRALRVLRVLRLISFIPSMRRVVGGLFAALPSMASIFLLLMLTLSVAQALGQQAQILLERGDAARARQLAGVGAGGDDHLLRCQHPAALIVVQARHRPRQPAQARTIAVEAPAGRAEPEIDASLERRFDQRFGGDEGFHHGVAIARLRRHGLAEMQRHLVAHRRDRYRIFIDEDDRQATLGCFDPINIQFTSGTTGHPKGATLTHRNILNNGFFVGEVIRLTARDRLCIPVPLYHCFGMVMGNLGCLTHGATMVYPAEAFDPLSVLQAVQAERCTALYGVPTMFIAELAALATPEFDRRHGDVVATMLVVGVDQLGQAALAMGVVQHVRQQQREGLVVADDVARAPDRMSQPQRLLLAGEARRASQRQIRRQRFELGRLVALAQRVFQLVGEVEMILDHRLVAAGDEDEMLDAGGAGLIHHMLEGGPVDDRQHLFRDRLGRREKASAETGDGEDGLADAFRHGRSIWRPGLAWLRRCGLKSGLLTACTKPIAS